MEENIENWSNLIVQYSAISRDNFETIRSKANEKKSKFEEDKLSNSEDSFADELMNDNKVVRNDNQSLNLQSLLESNSIYNEVNLVVNFNFYRRTKEDGLLSCHQYNRNSVKGM